MQPRRGLFLSFCTVINILWQPAFCPSWWHLVTTVTTAGPYWGWSVALKIKTVIWSNSIPPKGIHFLRFFCTLRFGQLKFWDLMGDSFSKVVLTIKESNCAMTFVNIYIKRFISLWYSHIRVDSVISSTPRKLWTNRCWINHTVRGDISGASLSMVEWW